MQLYRDFQPTEHDRKGASLPDRQDWLVMPIGHNRDSDLTAESNFRVAERLLDELDPKGEAHESHAFNHWGCGWFEIILIRPNTPCVSMAEAIEATLANCTLLDENDYNERVLDS